MNHWQPSAEGPHDPAPPSRVETLEFADSADSIATGAYLFYLAVRVVEPATQDAPTCARVRITPAFARWALQTRSLLERDPLHIAIYEDARPCWLVYGAQETPQDDEPHLGCIAVSHVCVDVDGVRWRTALSATNTPIETEPLCFEELRELLLRASAGSKRSSPPVQIVQCIPVALAHPVVSATAALRRHRASLHKAQCLPPALSEPKDTELES